MPRPEGWIGSDLRARGEIIQWLHDHGDEVHDPQGLIVGRMRTELGKGRSISALVTDMVNDGMLERELNGRRTPMLRIKDDWGLLAELGSKGYREVPNVPPEQQPVTVDGEVDLTQLAETLLAVVLKRAQPQASQGAATEKLREQVTALKGQVKQLRDDLILARESEAEQRRQADKMRESLAKAQSKVAAVADKQAKASARGKAKITELDPGAAALLKQLQDSLK